MSNLLPTDNSWGEEELVLRLPLGAIRLFGLTPPQAEVLGAAYPYFLSTVIDNTVPEIAHCQAYRLGQAPQVTRQQVTAADGQYAPLKTRVAGGIEVTGMEFHSRMLFDRQPSSTVLGVASESELAQPIVMENFLRIFTAHQALVSGGALLHSAGLVFDEQAYIFVGRSGAGKTTLTRKAHEAGATILSDDINLLLPEDDGFTAHAIPFMGDFGPLLAQQERRSYPVAAVVLLQQDKGLAATPVGPAEAVARLLVSCPFVNTDEEESERLFDILAGMTKALPVVQLENRRDSDIQSIMNTVRECLPNA